MTLGEKLYTLRAKRNMTQEQLAEKLQVSRQSISKWESDATRPDLGKLKFLAEFYQISLDKLLDEDVDIFSEETSSDLNQNTNCVANNQAMRMLRQIPLLQMVPVIMTHFIMTVVLHLVFLRKRLKILLLKSCRKITKHGNGLPSGLVPRAWH